MSSTPLFDQIARRAEARTSSPAPDAAPVSAMPSTAAPGPVQAPRPLAAPQSAPTPTSPVGTPVVRTVVPSALVAEIEGIPTRIAAVFRQDAALSAEQLALVDALGDSLIRVVVDALAIELDRIARDRAVRG